MTNIDKEHFLFGRIINLNDISKKLHVRNGIFTVFVHNQNYYKLTIGSANFKILQEIVSSYFKGINSVDTISNAYRKNTRLPSLKTCDLILP